TRSPQVATRQFMRIAGCRVPWAHEAVRPRIPFEPVSRRGEAPLELHAEFSIEVQKRSDSESPHECAISLQDYRVVRTRGKTNARVAIISKASKDLAASTTETPGPRREPPGR